MAQPPARPVTLSTIKTKMDELAQRATEQYTTSVNRLAPVVERLGGITRKLTTDLTELDRALNGFNPPQLKTMTTNINTLNNELAQLEQLLGMSGSGSGTSGEKPRPLLRPADFAALPAVPTNTPVVTSDDEESGSGSSDQQGGFSSIHPAHHGGYKWNRSASKSKSKTRKGKKGKRGKKSKRSKTRSKRS